MAVHPLLAGVADGGSEAAARSIWLAVVHQMARETGGAVVGGAVGPHRAGRDHYRIHVRSADGGRMRLLLHACGRLVAAADDADRDTLVPPFREIPRPDLFERAGLRVADPAELERPLTGAAISAWFERDRSDIEYHRPPRVGDVIFNWFD